MDCFVPRNDARSVTARHSPSLRGTKQSPSGDCFASLAMTRIPSLRGMKQPMTVQHELHHLDCRGLGPRNDRYTRSLTQPCTLAKAAGKAAGLVPPAMAMSGLPPPLPPTWVATKLARSPALTLPTVSAVTPAAI
jgi:hypothetical protein